MHREEMALRMNARLAGQLNIVDHRRKGICSYNVFMFKTSNLQDVNA
jgi:hypothetical protein